MSLWAVLLTGLLAGGASCAAVQGGLLAGVVARRRPSHTVVAGAGGEGGVAAAAAVPPEAVPVAGFLIGKLGSHTALGAVLGLVGDAAQLGFRARAVLQVAAGVVMLALAADLLGVVAVRRLLPHPPTAWGRLVRRSGRVGGAVGPAVLGAATVLIPCGVTLSMEFLAVASGSPLSGAAIMATFVVGTSPLFAAVGYAARRSTAVLRGRLAIMAGAAVLVAGVLAIDAGLTLGGSSVTLSSAWRSLRDGDAGSPVPPGPVADGSQRITITVRPRGYSPPRVAARAGVPTRLVLHSEGADGCTSAIVFPTLGVERILPEDGDTVIDVGPLRVGRHRYTCAMGMYSGTIEAVP
jgi:sulfite exporter TauE/SafE